MEITQTLYITDRKDWRNWLKQNYKTEKEIWLVYPKRATGKPRIERLRSLVAAKKVVKDVVDSLGDILSEEFVIPPDILIAIQANQEAWKNFQKFSDSYIRIRIAFIDGARKRPDEFKKRLQHFIEMTEKDKMFGFGGIEKHY